MGSQTESSMALLLKRAPGLKLLVRAFAAGAGATAGVHVYNSVIRIVVESRAWSSSAVARRVLWDQSPHFVKRCATSQLIPSGGKDDTVSFGNDPDVHRASLPPFPYTFPYS